jgi:DNA-directed RNA polymerase specialized sigma24 family protein
MELDEAIVILFGPPSSGSSQAYTMVASFLERCASRCGARDAENVAQHVLSRLLTRARGGETPWATPAAAKGYLAKCAEHAAIDEHRREQRQSRLPTDFSPEQAPTLNGDERALIEKVAGEARNRRAARYRPEFDATWRQLSAVVFEGTDLRDVLLAESTLQSGSSEADFIKARNRAYKNHERVRKSLLAAAVRMAEAGQLSADDAALAIACLRVLVRCQRSEAAGVSRSRKDGS